MTNAIYGVGLLGIATGCLLTSICVRVAIEPVKRGMKRFSNADGCIILVIGIDNVPEGMYACPVD